MILDAQEEKELFVIHETYSVNGDNLLTICIIKIC